VEIKYHLAWIIAIPDIRYFLVRTNRIVSMEDMSPT
jgi:hypothetical protein